jgi:hypothetical protein
VLLLTVDFECEVSLNFLLVKVVESVNELAQIMKDLSVLVIDQVCKILITCYK